MRRLLRIAGMTAVLVLLCSTVAAGKGPTALTITGYSLDGPIDISAVNGGGRGWWIEGAHEVFYVAPDGRATPEQSRFAHNTLLWSRDGVTMRLESAVSLDHAAAVATSMREPE